MTSIQAIQLPKESYVTVELPSDAVFLKAAANSGRIFLYYIADNNEPPVQYHFHLAATLEEIDCESQSVNYIDTVTYLHGAGDVTVHILQLERILQ